MGKLIRFLLHHISFVVFSADINENRRHIHAVKAQKDTKICKYWIEHKGQKDISMEYNYGFTRKELNKIEKLVNENYEIINKQLDDFYKGLTVKSIEI